MPSSAVLSSLGRIGKIKEPTVSLLSRPYPSDAGVLGKPTA